jgi:hypothetical protein
VPKPKAESWLTSAFAEGVPELSGINRPRPAPPYKGALGRCFLAHHDERRRPCKGPLERFHFLRRQTVEDALWALLRDAVVDEPCPLCVDGVVDGAYPCSGCQNGTFRAPLLRVEVNGLILLAAWDPRNAEIGCEGHHRRYDSHATPRLLLDYHQVPDRVIEFALDYGLENPFKYRFGAQLIGLDVDPQPSPPAHRLHPVSTLPTN